MGLAAARISELEAELAKAHSLAGDLFHRTRDLEIIKAKAEARIAELEAEQEHAVYAYVSARIADLEAERDGLLLTLDQRGERIDALSAERDRLREALTDISISDAGRFAIPADHVTWAIWRARAAFNPSGE